MLITKYSHHSLGPTHHLSDKGMFWGYASTPSVDHAGDRISKGAFGQSLQQWQSQHQRWPHLYEEHDQERLVGTCKTLKETDQGLYVVGKLFLDDIPRATTVYEQMLSGESCGLSIGFYVLKSISSKGERVISQLDLREISIVQHPCNPEAHIHECKNDHDPTLHQMQAFLRVLKMT